MASVCPQLFLFILDLHTPSPIQYNLTLRGHYTTRDISKLVLYVFIFVSGTIGNLLVIRSFIKTSDRPGTRFVICLEAIHVFASIFIPFHNIILIMYDNHWPPGYVGCIMMRCWTMTIYDACAWMLVAVSLAKAR